MGLRHINLRLTDQICDEIDKVRGDVTRPTWIKRAIELRLAEPLRITDDFTTESFSRATAAAHQVFKEAMAQYAAEQNQ